MQVLGETTISMGERIFAKQMSNEEQQVTRNLLLQAFVEKETWKKADLKKNLSSALAQQKVEFTDKDLTKFIGQFTMQISNNNLKLIQP